MLVYSSAHLWIFKINASLLVYSGRLGYSVQFRVLIRNSKENHQDSQLEVVTWYLLVRTVKCHFFWEYNRCRIFFSSAFFAVVPSDDIYLFQWNSYFLLFFLLLHAYAFFSYKNDIISLFFEILFLLFFIISVGDNWYSKKRVKMHFLSLSKLQFISDNQT